MFRILLPVLVLAASTGEAQKGKGGAQNPQGTAATWAQCSGSAFAGPTNCPKGTFCSFGNPWYSQCLPGNANQPFEGIPDEPLGIIETRSQVTVITIGPPNRPTLVTTLITFLTPARTQPPWLDTPASSSLTVIGGVTYTLIEDPPYSGNRRRGIATAMPKLTAMPLATPTPEAWL